MYDILIFGGTTEGRELALFCDKNGITAYLSVATDYGASIVDTSDKLRVVKGRMTCDDMKDFICKNSITLVADATHPFAVDVTQNIKTACSLTATKYLRLKRTPCKTCKSAKYFDSLGEAVQYVKNLGGNILVTTGSKELEPYRSIESFESRCSVRVLDCENSVNECRRFGFNNIIVGTPPFSEEENIQHINMCNARFVITKDSGSLGGFNDKVSAAEKCKAELLVIKRPDEEGFSIEETKNIILRSYNE